MGEFTIFATLKHGSRWLQNTADIVYNIDVANRNDWLERLKELMFKEASSQFGISKVKVKNFRRELIIPKPYFVYRDPYEVFISGIRTAADTSLLHPNDEMKRMWDGKIENIDVLLTNNGHFQYDYWQKLYTLLIHCDKDDIGLIDLADLSLFIRNNTLEDYTHKKEIYKFSDTIVTIEGIEIDIIEECKKANPKLWNTFMELIEKEKEALDKLIDKFRCRP